MQDAERPSKTRRKKDMHALQSLGESLVELSAAQLALVDMPEDLREAVREAQRIHAHEARRRQMQYIGRLMRDVDPAPIRAKLDSWRGQSREATAHLHAVERWRDRLLADDDALTAFAREHPHADLQALRTAIRETRRERAADRPPRHFRELFRLLREAMQARGGEPDGMIPA
jgi:ribosome-associated protein